MNLLNTYRRISKILVIKCDKAKTENESIDAFNKASEYKHHLENVKSDDDLSSLIKDVSIWAGSNPIATDQEVEYLMRSGK